MTKQFNPEDWRTWETVAPDLYWQLKEAVEGLREIEPEDQPVIEEIASDKPVSLMSARARQWICQEVNHCMDLLAGPGDKPLVPRWVAARIYLACGALKKRPEGQVDYILGRNNRTYTKKTGDFCIEGQWYDWQGIYEDDDE